MFSALCAVKGFLLFLCRINDLAGRRFWRKYRACRINNLARFSVRTNIAKSYIRTLGPFPGPWARSGIAVGLGVVPRTIVDARGLSGPAKGISRVASRDDLGSGARVLSQALELSAIESASRFSKSNRISYFRK